MHSGCAVRHCQFSQVALEKHASMHYDRSDLLTATAACRDEHKKTQPNVTVGRRLVYLFVVELDSQV